MTMSEDEIKICCICNKTSASYKCPTCKKPYCSVICCKEHKTQVCEPPKVPEELERSQESSTCQTETRQRYMFPTEDTVPIEKLEQLRYSEELKQCLENPYICDVIKEVVHSNNPTSAIAKAMLMPTFVEVANACLKVVELPEEDRPC